MTGASLAISLLVLYLVWTKVWTPTILSIVKNELLFLRDDAYFYFRDTDEGLTNPAYISLCNFIDQGIANSKHFTLTNFFIVKRIHDKHGDVIHNEMKRHKQDLPICDNETAQFIEKTERRCIQLLAGLVIAKNFFATLLMVFCLIGAFLQSALVWICERIKDCSSKPRYAAVFCAAIMAILCFFPLQRSYHAFERYVAQAQTIRA